MLDEQVYARVTSEQLDTLLNALVARSAAA
jgi:hypothetical protein